MGNHRTIVLAALLVFIGGALGTGLRIGIQSRVPSTYIALAAVNIFGSFVLGWFIAARHSRNQMLRSLVATGLLGGFTTYSALSFMVTSGIVNGRWFQAAAFAAISVAGGLAAAVFGSRRVPA